MCGSVEEDLRCGEEGGRGLQVEATRVREGDGEGGVSEWRHSAAQVVRNNAARKHPQLPGVGDRKQL